MNDVQRATQSILERRHAVPTSESMLVAVSGIDGSGKGYLTNHLVRELRECGVHAVGINVDGWLNLPSTRFHPDQPAEHFYHHAIRFDAMFEQLILPLQRQRSIRVEADFAEETAHAYRRHTYEYQNVDVILLEGIYLLKRAFREHFHWTIWVDCTFETALERALQRGQEGLPADETIQAYRTIYFPAQEIHFRTDDPRAHANIVVTNDPRLGPRVPDVPG